MTPEERASKIVAPMPAPFGYATDSACDLSQKIAAAIRAAEDAAYQCGLEDAAQVVGVLFPCSIGIDSPVCSCGACMARAQIRALAEKEEK